MGLLEQEIKSRNLPELFRNKDNEAVQNESGWRSRREEIKKSALQRVLRLFPKNYASNSR